MRNLWNKYPGIQFLLTFGGLLLALIILVVWGLQ